MSGAAPTPPKRCERTASRTARRSTSPPPPTHPPIDPPAMESLTIPQLLTLLQSSRRPAADFPRAAQILQSKQDSLIDELTLKEVVIVETKAGCQSLQRSLADQSEKLQQSETELARVSRLYEEACKRAQRAEDKLEFFIEAHKDRYRENRIIDISDSDNDYTVVDDAEFGLVERKSLIPKRKRAARVVDSDSEDEDDDKIPLSRLMRKMGGARAGARESSTPGGVSPSRADKRVLRNRANVRRRIVFSDGSDSEGESLDGFIVNDSGGGSEGNSGSGSDSTSGEGEEESDSDVDLHDVLAKIQRVKNSKSVTWEYEADMLVTFAKNDELCMEAVCDLWRLQTEEEKNVKHVVVLNNQGFDKFDAKRASYMAEFLTDGDRDGSLKKTVEELQKFDPRGVEYCRKLAFHYSGQLFSLYGNTKDSSTPS